MPVAAQDSLQVLGPPLMPPRRPYWRSGGARAAACWRRNGTARKSKGSNNGWLNKAGCNLRLVKQLELISIFEEHVDNVNLRLVRFKLGMSG